MWRPGEYKIRPYKGFPGGGRGSAGFCVHPEFTRSFETACSCSPDIPGQPSRGKTGIGTRDSACCPGKFKYANHRKA